MMKFKFPRLTTHLAILAISTLTLTNATIGRAAQSTDVILVDAPFVPHVLTSISALVPSPYVDSTSLINPLGVDRPVVARTDAIGSVVSQAPPQAATASLTTSSRESETIALPRARDFTLTARMTTSIELARENGAIVGSFALIGR